MKGKGLVRLRSHLLPESRLINLPLGTEMFHFPRCHIIEVFLLGNQRFIAVCLAFAFRGGVRPFPKRPGHPPGASFFLYDYTNTKDSTTEVMGSLAWEGLFVP